MCTSRLVALAALAAGASAGCDVCSEELFERTKGQECGPFEREARGKWADWTTLAPDVSCLEDVCCALHEDDCCVASVRRAVATPDSAAMPREMMHRQREEASVQ